MSETRRANEIIATVYLIGLATGLLALLWSQTWFGFAKALAWLAFWTFCAHETEPTPEPSGASPTLRSNQRCES